MQDCQSHCQIKKKTDYLLWGCIIIILSAYGVSMLEHQSVKLGVFTSAVTEMTERMWWGVVAGIFFAGVLDNVPREYIVSIFGSKRGVGSILRAGAAGILLDLCSHGILFVGMKLYERGISLGQLMTFLIASPWNSFSLTMILISLIGIKWSLAFIVLSFVIAVISGVIFELLVAKGVLPENPNQISLEENIKISEIISNITSNFSISPKTLLNVFATGFKASSMILKWVLFGVVIIALVRTFVSSEIFMSTFSPTLIGLAATIFFATVLEICSEGSTPIAADIFTRAHAPGNSFAFLMAGVSTDYTEIMALKETTKSWKIAFFLPLVTLPQVVVISIIMNLYGV